MPSSVSIEPAATAQTAASARRDAARSRPPVLAALLMVASGFAGLGYQIVWTQQLGLWLGHEIISVLAVVAAFFGGLAIGAQTLGRVAATSRRLAFWYAGCEALIAAWALLLHVLLTPAGALLVSLMGPQPSALWQWSVAFVGPFLLLLPATCAMGATLPLIERVGDRLRDQGHAIGALYAANTFGALLGVLGSSFVLVPMLGLRRTALVCALLNLLCVLAALLALPKVAPAPAASSRARGRSRLRILLFATGWLGIGYEVVVVRVLSQVAEDTVYTFALLLAVYLLGTAAGAALYQARGKTGADPSQVSRRLLTALAASCLLGAALLWIAPEVQGLVVGRLGAGIAAALAGEAAIAFAAFALPTVLMGALFSHLCVAAKAEGWRLGSALAINTFGAALAPLLFGVLLLPLYGPKGVLLLIVIAYALLGFVASGRSLRAAIAPVAIAFMAVLLATITGPLAFVDLPAGARVLSYRDGVMAAVSVVEDGDGIARLRINNRQQEGSSATLASDARLAYLPLLLHADPHKALFLGLGTGLTSGAAAEAGGLQVDAVELLPEVIAAAPAFDKAFADHAQRARPRVLAADARRYVRASQQRYDVIVADLFHPARSGAGALYTSEHFAAVRERLAAGGVFCQWLPLHQLDLQSLRSIVGAFMSAYPQGQALLASNSLDTPVLGLVARADGARFDIDALQRRRTDGRLPRLRALRLDDAFAVFGSFVAGPASLARFAAPAVVNRDDRPVVIHHAPWLTYAADTQPRERLSALLHELTIEPADLLAEAHDADAAQWRRRLAAYWRARTQFIDAGLQVRLQADPRRMLAQLREPLLAVLRTSPDFAAAYEPLLALSATVATVDREAAVPVLHELVRLVPARSEAAELLGRIESAP